MGVEDSLRSPDLSPRIRILLAIRAGYKRFEEISRATGLALATVSKYINILMSGGLVAKRDHHYELTDSGSREIQRFHAMVEKAVA